jgi:hypothetical protein
MAQGQYRQIGICIVLEKIGFECISAHAEGFLKAVGLTKRLAPFRFDWRLGSPDGLRPIPSNRHLDHVRKDRI